MDMITYEENLHTNPLYLKLIENSDLLNQISVNNWLCLIPKRATITDKCLKSHEYLLSHVCTPSFELPKSHFISLLGEDVIINGKFIKTKSEATRSVTILFEEFFYTKDFQKFKLICIDAPISSKYITKNSNSCHEIVRNVHESVELLQKYGKKQVERKISNAIKNFNLRIQNTSEYETVQANLKLLYDYCCNLTLTNQRKLKETDSFLYMNLKIAIEYILMDVVYEKIFDVVACSSEEGHKFNKILRKLSNITLNDLGIAANENFTNEKLNPLKIELLKIDTCKNSFDKLTCIRNVIDEISTLNQKQLTITDEMLPILVYLIIKTNYFHWIPTLKFIKEFNLSQMLGPENQTAGSALQYILTTLEAVIFFIQTNENLPLENNQIVKPIKVDEIACKEDYLQYLFHYIKENNEIQLTKLLHVPYSAFLQNSNNDDKEEEVAIGTICCHPLCTCEKCDKRGDETSNVNVASYKDLTMLHIATIYNMPKILTMLTSNGANVNAQDANRMSALHYAASLGQQKILFLLLHAGSSVNLRNDKQQTPLILAAMNGHEQCVKALLFFAEHTHTSIEMNAQDAEGMTALHYSARCGFEMIIDVLLEYEAKATIKNNFGKISLDYAFNSIVATKLERAIKYQVEELPITENEFVFVRSDDLADVFNEDNNNGSDLASQV